MQVSFVDKLANLISFIEAATFNAPEGNLDSLLVGALNIVRN